MKIIGFSKINGQVKMVLKADSSLLVNRKPFFIPDWSNEIRMTPCVVLRVSRMGKNIGAKFASRYYDAIAPGLNICATDFISIDHVRAWAFDYSLPVGTFVELEQLDTQDMVIPFEEAIERASEVMTIRQGDLIFIDRNVESRHLHREETITYNLGENELLYCKIK